MPANAPSMLLDTIIVGPNTYMGVSRACDEAMATPSSVAKTRFWQNLVLANKATQRCHFKTYRALDHHVSTGIVTPRVENRDKYS